MDVFDRAQQIELAERERHIAEARALALRGPSLAECEGCGAEIPGERQRALPGVRECIDCARQRELAHKLFKRG